VLGASDPVPAETLMPDVPLPALLGVVCAPYDVLVPYSK